MTVVDFLIVLDFTLKTYYCPILFQGGKKIEESKYKATWDKERSLKFNLRYNPSIQKFLSQSFVLYGFIYVGPS